MSTDVDQAADSGVSKGIRLRLDIAYDGTDFHGWGRQPDLRTVQGELEQALATVFGRHGTPPTLTVAGRTDAGVHALGQVAHLDITPEQLASLTGSRPAADSSTSAGSGSGSLPDTASGAGALARRLNGIAGLDADIWVSSSRLAPSGFDARFSAVWRRYEYRVADAHAPRNPLDRRGTLWYPAHLNENAMHDAAQSLLGLYDWAAFCKSREGATSIRTLQEFDWARDQHGVLVANVRADAFCHSMVRALVGASIAVGEGKLSATRVIAIRDELLRTSEFKVVPAKGLSLIEVGYPDDNELGVRAEQTRARRTGPGQAE